MNDTPFHIREAQLSDLEAITEIYNEATLNLTATFDTEPKTMEEQENWFLSHDDRHPVYVIEQESGIIGWASISKWSDRCAYTETGEFSTYIHRDHRGKGHGTRLLNYLIEEAKRLGFHTIITRIVEGNIPSIRRMERAGFQKIGVMREVGKKFGKRLDVLFFQIIFNN